MTERVTYNAMTGRWTSNVARNHLFIVEEEGALRHIKGQCHMLRPDPDKLLTSPLVVEQFEDDTIVVLADAVSYHGSEPKFISRYGSHVNSRVVVAGVLPDGGLMGLSRTQVERLALAGGSRAYPRRLWYLPG